MCSLRHLYKLDSGPCERDTITIQKGRLLYPQPDFDPLIDGQVDDSSSRVGSSFVQSVPRGLKFVSIVCFKNVKAKNIKLQAKQEEMNMDLSFALQDKNKLMN